ncbi:YagK/YfjJ domain-containing protein [Undibacterium flavidum]|uniref:Inovirus-type Gp2 protein n=1 Tax=Undibacterium flavidum TaxID=2762297 RepID=A0ABR6YE94_9BURK|nr:inovirus-type Gp2 protein [Undibacterium flavidum]MBC3874882.1 inovirus-type Gp2 protein [Undibacterium flavidum]
MVKKKSSSANKFQTPSTIYSTIEKDLFSWLSDVDGIWALRDEPSKNCDLNVICSIHQFVLNVAQCSDPGFIKIQRDGYPLKYDSNKLSISLHELLLFALRKIDDRTFHYSEQVELFFRLIKLQANRFSTVHDQKPYRENIDNYFEFFIDFVEIVRTELKGEEFRSLFYARTRKVANNFRSTETYVKKILATHDTVRVFRIDLFASEIGSQSKPVLKQAQSYLGKFFRNWRHNKLFESIVGYIWKLEYSPLKGFYFHCVFFVSTIEVTDDCISVEKIGQYWVEQITKNQSEYFDCAKGIVEERKGGIGILCKDEPEKTQNLLSGIYYLFEKDLHFQFIIDGRSGKYRSYGRAE